LLDDLGVATAVGVGEGRDVGGAEGLRKDLVAGVEFVVKLVGGERGEAGVIQAVAADGDAGGLGDEAQLVEGQERFGGEVRVPIVLAGGLAGDGKEGGGAVFGLEDGEGVGQEIVVGVIEGEEDFAAMRGLPKGGGVVEDVGEGDKLEAEQTGGADGVPQAVRGDGETAVTGKVDGVGVNVMEREDNHGWGPDWRGE